MAQDIIKGLITFDREHQHGLYPYTQTDCVFDDDGTPLETLLNNYVTIWENPRPSANFPSQTINLDYSDYRYLVVFFKLYGSLTTSMVVDVSITDYHTIMFNVYSRNGFRNFRTYTNKTSIYFEKCNYYETYGGTASERNDMGRPIKIVGIK